MSRLIPAPVAAFALVAMAAFCTPQAIGQIHGTPSSVTSIGFGGHFDRVPGTPASVTSLGPQGYTAGDHAFNPQRCCINPLFPVNGKPPESGAQHPHHHPVPVGGAIYAVPYPVYVTDNPGDVEQQQESASPEYGPGPTIFDRRGSGETSANAEMAYAERMRDGQAAEPAPPPAAPASEPAPARPEPDTVLVFKDGHQTIVQNYAIIGDMLYDMSEGKRAKIAIADLDLVATAKQNDDRGVDFELPVRRKAKK